MSMNKFSMSATEAEKMIIKFIQERMEEWNWTVYRLSQETGIAESTIHRWFSGETKITAHKLLQLLGALEIRPFLVPAEMDDQEFVRITYN